MMGVSTQTISRWERGLNDVERDTDAEWIVENVGVDPPRPARTAVARVELEEQLRAVAGRLDHVEVRLGEAATREEVRGIRDLLQQLVDRPTGRGEPEPSG